MSFPFKRHQEKCEPYLPSQAPLRSAAVMPEATPPVLRIRTELLQELQALHVAREREREEMHSCESDAQGRVPLGGAFQDGDTCSAYDDDDVPLAAQFVRSCPPLADPSWAMEELLRINPHAAVWVGSALPSAVWAPPGSGHCPFGSTEADLVRIRNKPCLAARAVPNKMKLTAKLSGCGSESKTKELTISNPEATLNNLRAAIAVNFRLPLGGFRLQHATLDLSDDRQLLRSIGIQDGDTITVVAKHEREEVKEGSCRAREPATGELASTTGDTTAVGRSRGSVDNGVQGGEEGDVDGNDDDETEAEEGDEEESEDGGEGREALIMSLMGVPNLAEMRQRFVADPEGVLRLISVNNPQLFNLILRNRDTFLDLVQDENLIEELRQEREEMMALTEDEEGFDEMLEEMMSQFLGAAGDVDGDVSDEALGEEDVSETQRYLDRVATAEEEVKIEQLMQLGFTREQCKVAFFKAKRSIERAANLLLESPPQL